MSFPHKSLTIRILAPLLTMIAIGFVALIVVATSGVNGLFWSEVRDQNASKSLMLAEQMAAGVKWGKSESIERVAAPVLNRESSVGDILVRNAAGDTLYEFRSETEAMADLADGLENAAAVDGQPYRRYEGATHLLVSADIRDPKTEEVIGEAIFSWNEAAKAARIRSSLMVAIGVSLAFLLATTAAATLIVRLQVSRPIQAIKSAMSAVADGETDFEMPHRDRPDEIGAMAGSVVVFRDNVVEMRRLDAEKLEAERRVLEAKAAAEQKEAEKRAAAAEREQEEKARAAKAEADTRAADEEARRRDEERREADRLSAESERKEMMARLRETFGAVIDAAAAGDFTRRASTDFDDAELNELAAGLNKIVETMARGLEETCGVLEAVSHRNLSQRVRSAFEGEFAVLKEGVNLTADTLSRIVCELQDGSRELARKTQSVSAGFDDLSDRTTSQAASIEETSAAVDLLTRSVNQNAARAEQARDKASSARALAVDGGEIMDGASKAMDKVVNSSSEIAAIVEMIDSIAFQTNLLSLNASVEAARAGEAGSGFAVVAAEVRNLAQSAAASSAEIRELIERSRGEIQGGVDLVRRASTQLGAIVGGVNEVAELMEQISLDATEQASKLSEINGVVMHFDEITQRNAQLVEESTETLRQAGAKVEEIGGIARSFTLETDAKEAHDAA